MPPVFLPWFALLQFVLPEGVVGASPPSRRQRSRDHGSIPTTKAPACHVKRYCPPTIGWHDWGASAGFASCNRNPARLPPTGSPPSASRVISGTSTISTEPRCSVLTCRLSTLRHLASFFQRVRFVWSSPFGAVRDSAFPLEPANRWKYLVMGFKPFNCSQPKNPALSSEMLLFIHLFPSPQSEIDESFASFSF